jgi:multisubunit Na+/H+ antiporter MnhG subunit
VNVAASVLLVAGVALELIAVLGACVMRDTLDRLHYVSLASFGGLLIAVSIFLREPFSLIGDKALATGVLLLAISTVVVHTTARSHRIRALGDWREQIDEAREEVE